MIGNGSKGQPGTSALIIGLLGAISLFAATFGFGHDVDPAWFTLIFRALLVFIAVMLIVAYTVIQHANPLKSSTIKRSVTRLGPSQAKQLQSMAGSTPVSLVQAKIFATAILTPSSIRQRVTEHYIPGQRTLRQSVRVEMQIPLNLFRKPASEATTTAKSRNAPPDYQTDIPLHLPVVIPSKGELHDSFVLENVDGSAVPTLSYTQYLQVTAGVLRALLMKAYSKTDFRELPAEAKDAEERALLAIIQRRGTGVPDTSVDYINNLQARDRTALRMVAKLVEKLSTNYALLASVHCSADQRVVLRYEQTLIPEMKLTKARSGQVILWCKDRLRILLGARPVDLSVSIRHASTCQSYHLLVDSADGLYLAEQELSVNIADYFAGKKPVRGVPPYYRFRRRLGQTYSHFYARYFPEQRSDEPSPYARFTYFEVPPGSIFRAAVTSISGAGLVWIVGYVLSRKSDVGTDAPALLLAFPALAAAWLGFEAPSRRLLEATLTARLSLMITALTSIAGSGLFMVYRSGLPALHWHLPAHLTFLGITSLSWAMVTGIAILNAFATLYSCLLRTWEFKYLSARVRTEQVASEHG